MGIAERIAEELQRREDLKTAATIESAKRAAKLREEQQAKEIRLQQYETQRRQGQSERILQLLDSVQAKRQLLEVRDNVWNGVGEVDEEPTIIYNTSAGRGDCVGVLMLRAYYTQSAEDRITHSIDTGTWESPSFKQVVESSRAVNLDDFASVRVGIYLPYKPADGSIYFSDLSAERVGVKVLESAIGLHYQDLPSRQQHFSIYEYFRRSETHVQIGAWQFGHSSSERDFFDSMTILRGGEDHSKVLEDLLVAALIETPIDIASLKRSEPMRPNQQAKPNDSFFRRFIR